MAIFTYPPVTTLGIPPVAFHEAKEGSQDCAINTKAQVYKVVWKVAWADAENAKTALLGFTRAKPAAVGPPATPAFFSRLLPHALPKAPWLFCTDVLRAEGRDLDGTGGAAGRDANGMAVHKWSFLYCTYTKLGCDVFPDDDPTVVGAFGVPDESFLSRFVRKRRRSLLTFQSNRRGSWRWAEEGGFAVPYPVALPIPWRVPLLRLQWTWMGIPIKNLNEPYIDDTIGTTNLTPFAGYRAGSLLLNGAEWPDYFPIPGHSGLQVDITFDVVYYPPVIGGPNFFPDPQRNNTYHEVRSFDAAGNLVQPYPRREWANMFAPINVV